MDMVGKSQANALLVDHQAPTVVGKESIEGPGPFLTIHIHQWKRGQKDLRIANLDVKGVDIHPEVLWTVEEIGILTATGAVGGQGA